MYSECWLHGTKSGRITLTEHYMNQSWYASRLKWAKSHDSLAARLCVHVINGWVQGNETSFSCCTNSSSNLASYCWHYSFCVESSARSMIPHCMLLYRCQCVYVGTLNSWWNRLIIRVNSGAAKVDKDHRPAWMFQLLWTTRWRIASINTCMYCFQAPWYLF